MYAAFSDPDVDTAVKHRQARRIPAPPQSPPESSGTSYSSFSSSSSSSSQDVGFAVSEKQAGADQSLQDESRYLDRYYAAPAPQLHSVGMELKNFSSAFTSQQHSGPLTKEAAKEKPWISPRARAGKEGTGSAALYGD